MTRYYRIPIRTLKYEPFGFRKWYNNELIDYGELSECENLEEEYYFDSPFLTMNLTTINPNFFDRMKGDSFMNNNNRTSKKEYAKVREENTGEKTTMSSDVINASLIALLNDPTTPVEFKQEIKDYLINHESDDEQAKEALRELKQKDEEMKKKKEAERQRQQKCELARKRFVNEIRHYLSAIELFPPSFLNFDKEDEEALCELLREFEEEYKDKNKSFFNSLDILKSVPEIFGNPNPIFKSSPEKKSSPATSDKEDTHKVKQQPKNKNLIHELFKDEDTLRRMLGEYLI